MLIVSLLGEFSIKYKNVLIKDINTPRLQSLVAYLILNSGSPQHRSLLASHFWPDTNETQARTNLRNLLHQLRRAWPDADTYIDINQQTLQWRSEAAYLLDINNFRNSVKDGEQALRKFDLVRAQESFNQAIDFYLGDLLPSCYDDWITIYREDLRQVFLNALKQLISLLEEKRDYTSAIQYAQRLLQNNPLHEATYRSLIRLHALNNDRASALRVYHVCETVLQRELDLKPSITTREAYERLLGEEGRSSSTSKTIAFLPLVGREREWAQILQAWRSATANQGPKLLILCGEAGIGKTRLLEEMIQWAGRQGITNNNTHCYAAEGQLAFSPVITWLRAQPLATVEDVWLVEIARLLPEILSQRLDLSKPGPLTEQWQRERLFEALSWAILGLAQPFLLTIDDLQWCDRDTLEWLHFLLRFDPNARLLIIGTYRPEEVDSSHPLDSLLHALRTQGGITEINVPPLDENATRTLASMMTEKDISKETGQFLFRQTEGNPLFLVETLRAGIPLEKLAPEIKPVPIFPNDAKRVDTDLPLKVHSVLQARLAQLSQEALSLARLAATIGREFPFSLLVEASGRDENSLVNELDELWQRRILREQGVNAYDFSHDKLREVVYKSMSGGRRRLLHRQVAQALEAKHSLNLGPVSYQIAAHYEGAGLSEQAVPYYLQAAEMARKYYANHEARSLLQRGLAIIETKKNFDEQSKLLAECLWEGMGDLHKLSAEYEKALEAYRNAQNWVSSQKIIDQARIHRKIAETFRDVRKYTETLKACEQAETVLGQQPSEDINRWWNEWIDVQIEKVWAYYWSAQWQEVEALVERINLVVKVLASGVSRMRFLMASCLMNLRKFRYVVSDEMLANSEESLGISREYGSKQNQTDCLFELGFLHLWRRDLDQAEELLQLALGLAENTGNVLFQTLCLTYLTVLKRFRSQTKEVLEFTQRLEQVAEAANMPDYVAAAMANLAWLAWRRGDIAVVETKGRQALSLWLESPLVYPFQWQALWPLLGVSMAQGQEEETLIYVRALLEPTQQRLPEEINNFLMNAIQWRENGDVDNGLECINKAAALARVMGYL